MTHRNALSRTAAAAVAACSLMLAACGGGGASGNAASSGPVDGPPPLEGAKIDGRFALTDQDGRRVTDADFAGKYRLTYMGFAQCPDVCPVDLQVLGAGLRLFEAQSPERAARVQPLFITVDPERDTPAVLKSYVANFHPRLIGLTGSREEVDTTVRALGGSSIKGDVRPDGGYNVDHSRYILLMGPDSKPVAIVPHETPEALAAELDKWVR